jgi:hypothetical protein
VLKKCQVGASGPGGNVAPKHLPDLLVALTAGFQDVVNDFLRLPSDQIPLRVCGGRAPSVDGLGKTGTSSALFGVFLRAATGSSSLHFVQAPVLSK